MSPASSRHAGTRANTAHPESSTNIGADHDIDLQDEFLQLWSKGICLCVGNQTISKVPERKVHARDETTVECEIDSVPNSHFYVTVFVSPRDPNSGYLYAVIIADGIVMDHFLMNVAGKRLNRTFQSWGWQSPQAQAVYKYMWTSINDVHLGPGPSLNKKKNPYSLRLDRWINDGPGTIQIEVYDLGEDNSYLTTEQTIAVERPKCLCSYVSELRLSHHIKIDFSSSKPKSKNEYPLRRLPMTNFKELITGQPPFFSKIFSYKQNASLPPGMSICPPRIKVDSEDVLEHPPVKVNTIRGIDDANTATGSLSTRLMSYARNFFPLPKRKFTKASGHSSGQSSSPDATLFQPIPSGSKARYPQQKEQRSPSIELIPNAVQPKATSISGGVDDTLHYDSISSEDDYVNESSSSQSVISGRRHTRKRRRHQIEEEDDGDIPAASESIRATFMHGFNNVHFQSKASPRKLSSGQEKRASRKRPRSPLVILPSTPPDSRRNQPILTDRTHTDSHSELAELDHNPSPVPAESISDPSTSSTSSSQRNFLRNVTRVTGNDFYTKYKENLLNSNLLEED